jgi:hypothetical protein
MNPLPGGGAETAPGCIFKDLLIRGDDNTTDWWGTGIKVTDPALPVFRSVNIFGRSGGTSAQITSATDYGIQIEGGGLDVSPTFDDVFVLEYDTGLYLHSSANPGIEGIYVDKSDFVHCNTGVYCRSEASGGYKSIMFHMINCHVQAFIRGIRLFEVKGFNISHNFIYSSSTEDVTTEGIYVENSVDGIIADNRVEGLPVQTTMKGIVVDDCNDVTVSNNRCNTPGLAVEFAGITFDSLHGGTAQEGAGARFTDSANGPNNGLYRSTIPLSCAGTIAGAGTTNYFVTAMSATENLIYGVASASGIFRNLHIKQNTAPGVGQTTTYTLRVDGSDTAVTCQASGAAATTASDVTHSVAIASGQSWSLKIVQSGGAASTIAVAGIQFEPA